MQILSKNVIVRRRDLCQPVLVSALSFEALSPADTFLRFVTAWQEDPSSEEKRKCVVRFQMCNSMPNMYKPAVEVSIESFQEDPSEDFLLPNVTAKRK